MEFMKEFPNDAACLAREGGPKTGQYLKKREVVFAMVDGGRVVAMQAPSKYGYTLRNKIRNTVEPGSVM